MTTKDFIQNSIKGLAMGAANVVPGVSGGTIALITGIFTRLIEAIKSFNITALKLLFKGKFKEFANHIDLWFLCSVFLGIGVAILSLSRIFKYLFSNYPEYIWAFFFGLVLASVYYVGKTVKNWNIVSILCCIVGAAIAVYVSVSTPAAQNDNTIYLIICGAVAMCSMIVPGLSGSFVLILMGNYQLIMVDSISTLNFSVLLPVLVGATLGIISFSHFLSWLLNKYKSQTMALLTGFIFGSLGSLWPWKNAIEENFGGKIKTVGYEWLSPDFNSGLIIAIVCCLLGILSIYVTETLGAKYNTNNDEN